MGLGLSIFLAAVGAVLTFGITADVAGMNINVIGIILMLVGFVGGITSYAMSRRKRDEVHHHDDAPRREVHHHDGSTEREIVRER